MKKLILITAFLFCLNLLAQREFYELRTYELYQSSNFKDFNTYFEDYLIPTLNKKGINNIGVSLQSQISGFRSNACAYNTNIIYL